MTLILRSILQRAGARTTAVFGHAASRTMTRCAATRAVAPVAAVLFLAPLAACGPGVTEVDRQAVATSDAGSAAGTRQDPPHEVPVRARLRLTGDVSYDGPARVLCGPTAPRAVGSEDDPPHVVGRLAAAGREPEVGEPAEGAHADGPGFEILLEPLAGDGLAVTLHLPSAGERLEVPMAVALVDEDGGWRASAGTARALLDSGSRLTRSSATAYVSGSFTGSYQGEAGSGEVSGELERCSYFD